MIFKALSHGHLDAHPIWISCVHMNTHWLDAHPIESTLWGGLDAHSNRIVLLLMIHVRLRLPRDCWLGWLTRWLGLWRVFIAPFCSVLAAMLGKRGLFADGQLEWYSMVKLKARWFRCLQHLNLMYYSRPACRASGACLRTAFQLVLVSWYSILQSCVADLPTYYCSNAWYGDY